MNTQAQGLGVITRYGVSSELLGHFDALRQTPAPTLGDRYKFSNKVVDAVARDLLSRNYKTRCWELAHFLSAIVHGYQDDTGAPLLCFFWVDEVVTPARFRQAFAGSNSSQVLLGEQFLTLTYEQKSFDISPSRADELAAWMELLVAIDPEVLKRAEQALQALTEEAIRGFANALQSMLYAYLSNHMQPAQQEKRFAALWAWLTGEERAAKDMVLSDDLIVACWVDLARDDIELARHGKEALGFRRYRSVVDDMLALRKAFQMAEARRGIEASVSIGEGREEGEVSLDTLSEVWEAVEERDDNYSWLSETPKFLTGRTLETLGALLTFGPVAKEWPLTLQRYDVFGDWQAQLIQAVRNQADVDSALAAGPGVDYVEHIQSISDLDETLDTAFAAGLHILLALQTSEALEWVMEMLSPGDVQVLRAQLPFDEAEFERVMDDDLLEEGEQQALIEAVQANCVAAFYDRLPQLRLQAPSLNQLVDGAKSAFKAVNRAGFKVLPDQSAVGEYVRGMVGVAEIQQRKRTVFATRAWDKSIAGENFFADVSIFSDVFRELHGGGSE